MKADEAIGLESMETWSVTQGRRKPARLLLLSVLLVLMCLPGVIGTFSWWSVFGIGLFGGTVALATWRLLHADQVVVRVDAEGVDLRPATARGGFVRWSELKGTAAWTQAIPPGIHVRAVFVERQVGRMIVIQQEEVACSADEVVAAIRHFWARHQEGEDFPADDQALGRTSAMRGGSGRAS